MKLRVTTGVSPNSRVTQGLCGHWAPHCFIRHFLQPLGMSEATQNSPLHDNCHSSIPLAGAVLTGNRFLN